MEKLSNQLFHLIKDNPPVRLKKWGDSEGDIRAALIRDLTSKFEFKIPTYKPELSILYKDISYETINSDDFSKA